MDVDIQNYFTCILKKKQGSDIPEFLIIIMNNYIIFLELVKRDISFFIRPLKRK